MNMDTETIWWETVEHLVNIKVNENIAVNIGNVNIEMNLYVFKLSDQTYWFSFSLFT